MVNQILQINQLPETTLLGSSDVLAVQISGAPNFLTRKITAANLANQLLTTVGAFTADRALISNVNGGIGVSPTTSTEIGYLSGVTSALQSQIDAKQMQLNGTGFVKAIGTTISYDNSTYVPTSRTISATSPLNGGGDLSANRTLTITQATTSTDGYLSSADWNTFNNKQAAGTYVTGVTAGDGTITIGGSATAPTVAVNLSNANTWAALQTYPDTLFKLTDDVDPTKTMQFQLSSLTAGTTQTITVPNLAAITMATISTVTQTFSGTTTFSAPSVTVGSSTGAATYGLGTGATLNATTKAINIGINGVSGSTTNIAIGSNVSGALGTLTIHSPTLNFGTNNTRVAIPDGSLRITNTADSTKQIAFSAAGITTATTRTYTLPDVTDTIVTLTATQTLTAKTLTSPVLTTPVINGASTGTGVASAATASTLVLRDANANISTNAILEGYTTTVTAAGTTVLTVGSTYQQFFTGTTTQTVTLPVTSTLVLGQAYFIVNNSTGSVTVNSSGANLVVTLAGGQTAIITCILLTGTTAASWSVERLSAGSGVTSVATAGLATGGTITGSGTVTVAAAVQSDMETGTSTTTAVTPAVFQFHPSAPKAWCSYGHVGGTPTIKTSYNVTSITDIGTGDAKINLTISLSVTGCQFVSVITPQLVFVGGASTTSIMEVLTTSMAGLAGDTLYATALYMGDI